MIYGVIYGAELGCFSSEYSKVSFWIYKKSWSRN